MFKLALNAGHGLNTAGKRCMAALDPNQTREWQLNSRICERIEAILSEYDGIEILRIDDRTGKTDRALKTRTDKANAWGADFYLSVHHNAGINGGAGGGTEVYTYTSVDEKTADWQRSLYNAVIANTGLRGNRSNPLGKKDLHECRETNMPACLIECGFMDSATDVPVILTEAFANGVAGACANVVVSKNGAVRKTAQPRGYLDGAHSGGAHGWAYNQRDDTPVEVHICLSNGTNDVFDTGRIKADLYRPDLKDAGIGNGKHGFEYNFPDLYPLIGAGTFTVRAYAIGGDNPQLSGTHDITIAAPIVEPQPEAPAEPVPETPVAPPAPETPDEAAPVIEPKPPDPEEMRPEVLEPFKESPGILSALKALLKIILSWFNK